MQSLCCGMLAYSASPFRDVVDTVELAEAALLLLAVRLSIYFYGLPAYALVCLDKLPRHRFGSSYLPIAIGGSRSSACVSLDVCQLGVYSGHVNPFGVDSVELRWGFASC
eukprot:4616696-Amphidinium_carterae.1